MSFVGCARMLVLTGAVFHALLIQSNLKILHHHRKVTISNCVNIELYKLNEKGQILIYVYNHLKAQCGVALRIS